MEARAHAHHSFTQDCDHDFDFTQRYCGARFPSYANHRDPIDSEDQLRLSKQLWDRRWSRWWGYSWRRKRDLALRRQRYLNNRERFLRPVYSENETEHCPRKHVSFCGRDHLTPPPSTPQGLRRKLGRFLSASGAQIGRAGRCIARRFKRSPPRAKDQATVPCMEVPPTDWTCPRTWHYACDPTSEDRPWHRSQGLPPADASLHSLEQLSRRLERLRTGDRAAPPRPTLSHRGCGTEYVTEGDNDKEFSRSSLPRSCSRSVVRESWPTFSERQQQSNPVVVNMQRNDSNPVLRDLKYDRSKLAMNQGLPFMYPHYPNVYTSSGGAGHESRLFSSVATQTDQRQIEEKVAEVNVTRVQGPRTRNSETQTQAIPQRDKETQWVNPRDASRTFSTQTAVNSSNASQQMPSISEMCLLESQKANDELVNLCSSFVRADSIRSVFGSNKTHVVIYRPELGEDEDDSTVKLTEMEVFLPSAVSYDRYYAELTSDGKASPSLSPRTPRENGQLTESVTPFIEVTSIEDQGEGEIKKKKKKWFCHKH